MPEKISGPEIIDPEKFPMTVSDMSQGALHQQAMMGHGGLKMHRLLNEDAVVRIMPETMGTRMSLNEGENVITEMGKAFYEMGDLSGSRQVAEYRRNVPNPFSVTMTSSRIVDPRGVWMGTAANVARAHQDAFDKEPETERLLKFIRETGHDATHLSLVMEIPGMKVEDLEILQSGLEYLNRGFDYRLQARKIDISTALQSAIARTKQCQVGYGGGEIAALTTDERGPDGGVITVISIPDCSITLREAQEVDEGDTTKIIVERPIFAA